jgi:hypothetical protein
MIRVTPFAITSPFQYPVNGPNLSGTDTEPAFYTELNEMLGYSAILNDTLKVISEYWASSSGATLWMGIGIQSARNTRLTLSDTVRLFFSMGVAVYDAGISCWSYKRMYQSVRPISAVPCYANPTITSWRGPYQGVGTISSSAYQTYLLTPPFSEYLSGHSTWSGAASVVLRNFFNGDDTFRGDSVTYPEGSSIIEGRLTVGQPGYVGGVTDVPNTGAASIGYVPATNVTLSWATYTDAQNEAGISRLYGGFHFKAADEDAKALGRLIGQRAWEVASTYWNVNNSTTTGGFTTGTTQTQTGLVTTGGATGGTSEGESSSHAEKIYFAFLSIVMAIFYAL